MTNQAQLPRHIAIIMDGNGRWAKNRFLPRIAGHRAGVEAARRTVKHCAKLGIKVLSLFAFSSENWRRPKEEVNHLMGLFLTGLEKESDMLHDNHVRLRFIGDRARLNEELQRKINEVEAKTVDNKRLTLIIAVDYGGQWDICQAVKKLAKEVEDGKLKSGDITPERFATKLSFSDLPDPDLFIRTSGELRISNFMLWQLAYTELYFPTVLWPDFNESTIEDAIAHFNGRERRYGYNSEQIAVMQ